MCGLKLASMPGLLRDMKRSKISALGFKEPFAPFLHYAKNGIKDCFALSQALSFIEFDSSFSEEEKQLSKPLKISCKLNNAACKLRLNYYKEAKELCTEVLYTE